MAASWLNGPGGGRVYWLDAKGEISRARANPRNVVARPATVDLAGEAPTHEWVSQWCAWIFQHGGAYAARSLVVVDEAGWSMRGTHPPPGLAAIILQGRTRGLSYILATQRPSDVPSKVRGQAEQRFFFALQDHVDVEAAERDGAPRGLRDLKAGQFFHIGVGRPHLHRGALTSCTGEENG